MNYKLILSILKEQNYFIIEGDWERSVKDHPDFPQLNAIADILSQYGIDNYIAQVPQELFDDLPDIFIGIVSYDNHLESAVINKINAEKIKISFFDSAMNVDKQEFLKIWNGYTLVIEENEKKQLIQTTKTESHNHFPFFILGFLFISFLISNYFFNFLNSFSVSLLIVNGLGLFLSYLAIKESIGFSNKYLFKVCSTIKNGNCNQVIKSNNANLFYGMTYSDFSFIFFTYSFFITFFIKNYSVLLSLNIFFLPISIITIIFTIYQQKFVLKKWCLLCLGISVLVLTQSIIIIVFSGFQNAFNIHSFFLLTFVFLFITTLWYFLKPQFNRLSELMFEKYQRGEIYKDKEVFDLYFIRSAVILKRDFENLLPIKLNFAENHDTLTLILSPNCDYCKYEYLNLKKILFYFKHKINISVIFNFDKSEVDENIIELTEILYNLKDDIGKSTEALDDFLIKNFSAKKWLKKWKPLNPILTEITSNNIEILKENNITDSPCLLFNNRLYPKEYKIEDIKYFLNGIINTD